MDKVVFIQFKCPSCDKQLSMKVSKKELKSWYDEARNILVKKKVKKDE